MSFINSNSGSILSGINPIIFKNNHLWEQISHTDNLQQAYDWLCNNIKKQHPNQDIWRYRQHWQQRLPLLAQALQRGEFDFQTVKVVETNDKNGQLSRLEVRSPEDKLVIRAITQVIKRHLGPTLSEECTHLEGNGGLPQAVRDTEQFLINNPHSHVIKSDVKGYYAHIDHVILTEQLRHVFPNEPILQRQLWQFMRRTTEFGGVFNDVEKGIPLGASLSPLLAALYLSPLDALANKQQSSCEQSFYRRYMDDWVWCIPSRWQLRKQLKKQYTVLHALGVQPHPDKTYIGKAAKGFDFLGFHYCPTGMTLADTTLSRHKAKLDRLYEQGASKKRMGQYRARWLGWVMSACAASVPVHALALPDLEGLYSSPAWSCSDVGPSSVCEGAVYTTPAVSPFGPSLYAVRWVGNGLPRDFPLVPLLLTDKPSSAVLPHRPALAIARSIIIST